MKTSPITPSLNAFCDGSISYRDSDALYELYHVHELTTREIGDLFDVDHVTIMYWLDKNDITVPDRRQAARDYDELHDEDWLREKYIEQRMRCQDIADELGCAKNAVIQALKRNGIGRRDLADYTGSDHWKWRGGEGIYIRLRQHYTGKWDKLAREVRERQYYRCYMCDTHEKNLRRALDVHHTIPIKAGGVNHLDNLMALCSPCHDTVERFTHGEMGTPLMDAMPEW